MSSNVGEGFLDNAEEYRLHSRRQADCETGSLDLDGGSPRFQHAVRVSAHRRQEPKLVERGHAYESKGDVYFAVRSFPPYGALSKRSTDSK